MNIWPGGAESDDDDEHHIYDQIEQHGWNVNNVMHIFDGLELADYEIDFDADDDFYGDDDDEWFEDYFDSDFEFRSDDEEDEAQRKFVTGIFKTLEDSAPVLNKLTFHRDSSKDNGSRLPRILAGQTETYETLHKLLEEIEILLRVWKNRVNHPFTAHLECSDCDKSFEAPGGLIMGQDYHESDVESDTTDHRYSFRSRTNVNMTLTRKKYCQSTKMYYNIFSSELEFEALQGQVKAMRKHIFNITFNLFLQNLPAEKLPSELWEKIWKMTLKNVEQEMPPTHTSGVREKSSRQWTLFENERITDCFGAAGNLHMILFEILFKHPYVMTLPQMFEMETTGNLAKFKWFRLYFFKFIRLLSMKFARLEVLDNGAPKQIALTDPMPIQKKIEKGQFYITSEQICLDSNQHADVDYYQDMAALKPLLMIFPNDQSPHVAILHGSPQLKRQVVISIWDILQNREVARIKTGLPVHEINLMLESGSKNCRKFSLTSRQISLVNLNDDNANEIEFFKWTLDFLQQKEAGAEAERKFCEIDSEKKQGLVIDPELQPDESKDNLDITLMTCHQSNQSDLHILQLRIFEGWLSDKRCSMILIDGNSDQPRILKRLPLPFAEMAIAPSSKNFPSIKDFKNEKFIFYQTHTESHADPSPKRPSKLWFFDMTVQKVINEYKDQDICELTEQPCCSSSNSVTENHSSCSYDARFDLKQNQFVIVKDFLAGFAVYSYEESGLKAPKLIHKGSMFFHYSRFILLNGIIYASCMKEPEMMPMNPDAIGQNYEHDNLEIIAADLQTRQAQTLACFGASTAENSKLLLNETHRKITYVPNDHWIMKPCLSSVNDHVFTFQSNRSALIKVDFSQNAESIAITESTVMYEAQQEQEKKLRKAGNIKKKAQEKKIALEENREKMVQKYLNSDEHSIEGTIINWNRTYGFLKPSGEAKVLGNIFAHYSNMINPPPKTSIRNGLWIKGKLSKNEEKSKFMAVDIVFIDKPGSNNEENRHNGASGHHSTNGGTVRHHHANGAGSRHYQSNGGGASANYHNNGANRRRGGRGGARGHGGRGRGRGRGRGGGGFSKASHYNKHE